MGEFCARRALRTEQLRNEFGPDAKITWLIYRQGYEDRAKQEHQDLISLINTVRDKFNINLVWFGPGQEVINYINNGQPRDQMKVVDFEYFGHSNRACFMFDYSNNIDSACKSWLHDSDLTKSIATHSRSHAYCKSWGCHTGEEMSKKLEPLNDTRIIGVLGKTQFMMEELPILVWGAPGGSIERLGKPRNGQASPRGRASGTRASQLITDSRLLDCRFLLSPEFRPF